MSLQNLHEACGDIRRQLTLVTNIYAALMKEKADAADGHRRGTFSQGGSGQVPEVDDDGREKFVMVDGKKQRVMAPSPPHSDPTYGAVVARDDQAGQFNASMVGLEAAARSAFKVLEAAIGRGLNVLQPPKEPPAPARDDICACCDNAVSATETQKEQRQKRWGKAHVHAELCDWCATFVVLHGRRPPKSLIQKHESGQRIYDRDIAEALGRTA